MSESYNFINQLLSQKEIHIINTRITYFFNLSYFHIVDFQKIFQRESCCFCDVRFFAFLGHTYHEKN